MRALAKPVHTNLVAFWETNVYINVFVVAIASFLEALSINKLEGTFQFESAHLSKEEFATNLKPATTPAFPFIILRSMKNLSQIQNFQTAQS